MSGFGQSEVAYRPQIAAKRNPPSVSSVVWSMTTRRSPQKRTRSILAAHARQARLHDDRLRRVRSANEPGEQSARGP